MAPRKRRKRGSSSHSCRAPTPPPPKVTIEDIKVRVQKLKRKHMKEIDRKQSDFRIFYDIVLSEKCCNSQKEIIVSSKSEIWDMPTEQRGKKMKELTIDALNTHKERSRNDGKCCHLSCDTDINILLRLDQIWQYLWLYAEGLISSQISDIYQTSASRQRAVQSRVVNVLDNPWCVGVSFESRDKKWLAIKQVIRELKYRSGKSVAKVYIILSRVIAKLNKEISRSGIEFNESMVLSKRNQKRTKTMNAIIDSTKTCVKSMMRRITKDKLELLTGVAAICLPRTEHKLMEPACNILGFNRCSSYVRIAMENRAAFDTFLSLSGDINVGEKVLCRAGIGKLVSITNTSCTVALEPWNNEITYDPRSKARLSRWEPPLDEYERIERKDTTPKEYIEAIDSFLRQHNHQSPNTKDVITRRHPDNPSVKETAIKIYRYESWDALWHEFQKAYPGIAEKIATK